MEYGSTPHVARVIGLITPEHIQIISHCIHIKWLLEHTEIVSMFQPFDVNKRDVHQSFGMHCQSPVHPEAQSRLSWKSRAWADGLPLWWS